MKSRLEANIFSQPDLIRAVLARKAPAWFPLLRPRRFFFVGTGSSYFAARIAEWLWRGRVSCEAHAVSSFDFVKLDQPVAIGDVVVLFSHSGSRSYTSEAALKAAKLGALVIGVTAKKSPWSEGLQYRLETCAREEIEVFTKSVTTALAWVVLMTGDEKLRREAVAACAKIAAGPRFPEIPPGGDVILVGDLGREWIARETALKVQEASGYPARAFGLEEFLHGPRFSAGARSVVVGFSDSSEPRWQAARDHLRREKVPFMEIDSAWLVQLFWGQRLALALSRQAGADPDSRCEDKNDILRIRRLS